jgi:hypothetical protein
MWLFSVYRLVCVNTVEERILIRAQQKHVIQATVYAGGFKMGTNNASSELQDLFSGSELQQLLEVEPSAIAPSINVSPTSLIPTLMPSPSPPPSAEPAKVSGVKHSIDGVKEEQASKRQKTEQAERG